MRNAIDNQAGGSTERAPRKLDGERGSEGARSVIRVHCEHCGTIAASSNVNAEIRCACGSLLARKVPGGYELKCRRCKRAVVVNDPPAAD
jgi:phage FluMu protein Com